VAALLIATTLTLGIRTWSHGYVVSQ
jgi:hypothetical protein